MLIAGIYSFNDGKEVIGKQHRSELEEVLQVIEAVDAEYCKTKVSKEKTMKDKILYSPPALNEAFKEQFTSKGWINHKVIAEYSKEYYVPGYTAPVRSGREQAPYRDMDFVKSDIDIPVLIFGIDTDGLKPRDLKIAEPKQQYLFVDEILNIQGEW